MTSGARVAFFCSSFHGQFVAAESAIRTSRPVSAHVVAGVGAVESAKLRHRGFTEGRRGRRSAPVMLAEGTGSAGGAEWQSASGGCA
eukprot:6459703-Pyramimonas_sp.AAC.1